MTKITLTKKRGEFLTSLKGLFSVLHIKGKTFSLAVTHNILVLKEALSGYLFDNPSEDYKVLLMEFKSIVDSDADDIEAQVQAIKDNNPEIMAAREAQLQQLEQDLEVELTIEFEAISQDVLTEEITAEKLLSIQEFVLEE